MCNRSRAWFGKTRWWLVAGFVITACCLQANGEESSALGVLKPLERSASASSQPTPYKVVTNVLESPSTPGFTPPRFQPITNTESFFPDPALKQELNVTNLLKVARQHRTAGQFQEATSAYVAILENEPAEHYQKIALLELAQMAMDQNNLPRAQEVFSQFCSRWPDDPGIPEILLRQGILYREMGLFKMATSKFYAVMTSSLVLKPERLEYYQKLVRRAQSEVANTEFYSGNWEASMESLKRLLRSEPPPEDPASIRHKLVLCSSALGHSADVVAQAQVFLDSHPAAAERAEVRFLSAMALKDLGRSGEAFDQVLSLLKEQRTSPTLDPAVLAYWQRRAGNEIANRFYQEGDSAKALEIYTVLASLDNTPEWQMPAWYQVGLVLEHLGQPAKAVDYYTRISERATALGTNATAGARTVVEMATWRRDFLTWRLKTETTNLTFRTTLVGTNRNDVLPN